MEMLDVIQSWEEVVAQAEHYKAIGKTNIYLPGSLKAPWEYTTSAKSGTERGFGPDTWVWFTAKHPCGITFEWCTDLQVFKPFKVHPDSNIRDNIVLDIELIRNLLYWLPLEPRADLINILRPIALTMEQYGKEFQIQADTQRAHASDMWTLIVLER